MLRDLEGLHRGQTCALVSVMMSSNHSPEIKIGLAARQEAAVLSLSVKATLCFTSQIVVGGICFSVILICVSCSIN